MVPAETPTRFPAETLADARGQLSRQAEIKASAATGIDTVVRNLGKDPELLLCEHALAPDAAGIAPASIPLRSYTRLLEDAAQLTGEDHFGLLFGQQFAMTDLGPNGYLLMHARTVGDALSSFADHFEDLQEGSSVALEQHGDVARLSYQIGDPRVKCRRQDAEFTIMTVHNFFRGLLGSKWQLDRVDFAHAPKNSHRRHNQMLETPVAFRKPRNALYVQRALLDIPLPSHDPLLLRHLEDYFTERKHSRDSRHRLTKRIAFHVETELEGGGDPRLEDIAEAVGMSVRSVHRRLSAEGTSFRGIVLNCRLNAAKTLLRTTDIPLTVLGMQMGYGDATAFSRAFRKTVGISPQAWRQRHREAPPG